VLNEIFQFRNYRDYLKKEFAGTGENRGRRSFLARHLDCQTSFISQVLTERAHFSLEHAIQVSVFLNHTPLERKYFMLLVHADRSGSSTLKAHFEEEIVQIRKKRNEVKERINVRTQLSAEDQMTYYSAWHYSAIHILCALPDFRSVEAFSVRLKLDIPVVKRTLQFLEERGFVRKNSTGYEIGSTRIHLSNGSPMLPRHHANWRMKAIERVDNQKSHELHYSAVLGISRKDVKALKDRLLQLLEDFEPVIERSKEEEPIAFLMDLFTL
jgi:uncharacterized protein (TIGR02147 family)